MKVVFIDRDGTMGPNSNVEFPTQFHPFPDLITTVQLLQEHGFLVMAATNQSCIARGKDGGYDFAAEFRGYGLDDWFICPHDGPDNCNCRKPKPGLLLQAQEKYHGAINFGKSYVVGDRHTDIEAGRACGLGTVLVLTGRGREDMETAGADYIAADLAEAAGWIVSRAPFKKEDVHGLPGD